MYLITPVKRKLASIASSVATTTIGLSADALRFTPLATPAGSPGRTARVERDIPVGRQRVYEVLSDPQSYEDWVVGAKSIDDFDQSWPAPQSTFHHQQGLLLTIVEDTTSVLDNDPERKLVLEVRARPMLVARVEFRLVERGAGTTRVTMLETPTDGALHALDNRLLTRLIQLRNAETLRRLEHVAGS